MYLLAWAGYSGKKHEVEDVECVTQQMDDDINCLEADVTHVMLTEWTFKSLQGPSRSYIMERSSY